MPGDNDKVSGAGFPKEFSEGATQKNPVGIQASFNKPRGQLQKWILDSREINVTVVGQFTVDDMQLNTVGGVYYDVTSVNQAHPITQWIRGQQETITFVSEFFAEHANDEVTTRFQNLLRLTRRDEDLGRVPVSMFSFGTKLSMSCFVEHVANIAFGPLRPDGTPQRVRFTVTLRSYTPSLVKPTDPTTVPHQSRLRESKTWDTYESIAADEYGDAIKGEFLRRWSGYRPDLTEGDKVHILTLEYVTKQGPIRPQAPILYETSTNPKLASLLFAARSGSLKAV
jgi:hypothetical protein